MNQNDYGWFERNYPKFVRHQTKSGWRYFRPISGYNSGQIRIEPAPPGVLMIDFTRRSGPETVGSDPANPSYADILRWHSWFDWRERYEDIVLVFWTKSPQKVMSIYRPMIEYLQSQGVTFLMFVTRNGYYYPIEPYVTPQDQQLQEAVNVLGHTAIRYRFDPIIVGTQPDGSRIPNQDHWKQLIEEAEMYGITRIVINFLVPHYKGAGNKLSVMDYSVYEPEIDEKRDILGEMLDVTPQHITLQGCAESYMFKDDFPGRILPAACTDPTWAMEVNPKLKDRQFHGSSSRSGKGIQCGCMYYSDLGIYENMGSDPCERGCVFCYAQSNPPIYGD